MRTARYGEGVSPGGVSVQGVSVQGGLSRGVSVREILSDRITDRCKNITFP